MTRRLVLSYVLVAAFVLLLVELPLGLTYAGRAEDRLLADIERDARVLATLVEERVESGDGESVGTITEQYARRSDARVVVTNAEGRSMVDTSSSGPARDFSTRPEIATALGGSQSTGIRRSDTLDEELAYVAVPISSDGRLTGVVRVSFPTDQMREEVTENWIRLGVLSVLVLLGAASVGWLISMWAVGPVDALEDGARRLAEGDLGGRADVRRGPPELRHLAATFNDMAARLEVLVGAQRAFVADASHQLRTPLTALRLRIESLESATADPSTDMEQARRDLVGIDEELDRLGRLVDGLLALARSEAATGTEVVDVGAGLFAVVERWTPLADERGVGLRPRVGDEELCARIVPGGLDQVLDNLLDNALSVAPAGSAVDLDVEVDGPDVVLRVRDRGPGLDAEERSRATDRFWRGRDAEPGGTGLGLAIVSELATASGGSTNLDEPARGGGLVVEVRFPACAAAG
jgi:signal transduction histidine kinase